ncbi:EEF1A lysine methyltransferase 1 [Tribolium madens]|uniref:EEF1A lysine methyltransferase 1 n=1 Tax=Tribolium madens TaxID=41895 RepID=UPI001CF7268F|nr:EEF1A lysine methyltransferase 1 [Tribolium madens]
MSDEEDDKPQLSASTFQALQEFYKEQEEREKRFLSSDENPTLDENWQLSQFWYDDKTTENLVNVALKEVGPEGKIALVSCPTLYKKMKECLSEKGEVTLYEYDHRFSVYGKDFIPYDYKSPLGVPREKASCYDLVIADPPFLSEECLTKVAATLKFLTKEKIILCTGAVMEKFVERLLDLKKTPLKPQHRNNLGNEFYCYSNFKIEC